MPKKPKTTARDGSRTVKIKEHSKTKMYAFDGPRRVEIRSNHKSILAHRTHHLSNMVESIGLGMATNLNEIVVSLMRQQGLDPEVRHNRLFHKLILRAQAAILLHE